MPKVKIEDKMATEIFTAYDAVAKSAEDKNPCGPIALAIALNRSFEEVSEVLENEGRAKSDLTTVAQVKKVIREFGCKISEVKMQNIIDEFPAPHDTLKNLTMHHPVRFKDVWPEGTYLAFTNGHVASVVEGTVHDYTRGSGKRITRLIKIEFPEDYVFDSEETEPEAAESEAAEPEATEPESTESESVESAAA